MQVCFEKRLVITHELDEPGATAAAYGELGEIHRLLGHYEQSISCMERRIEMARYDMFQQIYMFYATLTILCIKMRQFKEILLDP